MKGALHFSGLITMMGKIWRFQTVDYFEFSLKVFSGGLLRPARIEESNFSLHLEIYADKSISS